jgi:hypothetical protein
MSRPSEHIVGLQDERREEFESDSRPIEIFRFTIHTTGQMGASLNSHNHVTVFFILDSGEDSVRINMQLGGIKFPEAEDTTLGILEWESFNYTNSRSALYEHDVPCFRHGLTVGEVYKTMRYEWQSRLYAFSGGDSGCRYWTIKLAEQLANKGWINVDRVEPLREALSYQYSMLQPRVKCHDPEGDFMTSEEWEEEWRLLVE